MTDTKLNRGSLSAEICVSIINKQVQCDSDSWTVSQGLTISGQQLVLSVGKKIKCILVRNVGTILQNEICILKNSPTNSDICRLDGVTFDLI
jgi:hypothetical protein